MAHRFEIWFLLTFLPNVWLSHQTGEHAYQQFIGCEFNSHGQTGHFWNYGYNGKDVMHIDLTKEAMVSSDEAAQFLVEERKSLEYFRFKEARLKKVCSAVQTVFLLSNNSLSRTVKPKGHVHVAEEMGQNFLVCSVHGFYPNIIRVQWTRKGRPVYYGTSTTGVLPHKDGTFQMTSYLSFGNLSAYEVTCEIEHISIEGKMSVALEYTPIHFLWSAAVTMCLVGFILPVATTILIICWLHSEPSSNTTNDQSDDSDSNSVRLMDLAAG